MIDVHPEAKTHYKIGDRVFGSAQGCYAEKLSCHPNMALPIPDNLSFEQAAGLFITYPTSYAALAVRAKLQKGKPLTSPFGYLSHRRSLGPMP